MKKLVLGFMFAAITSQAAGCIFVSDDDPPIGEDAVIEATWQFNSLSGTDTACPPDVDTVAVITTEVDSNDNPIGSPITDLYDCVDYGGISDPLPPSRISVYLEARSGNTLRGQTFSEVVDITNVNRTIDFEFLSDAGYFRFDWELVGASSGNTLECADIADIAGVGLVATLSGTTSATDDQFDCEAYTGVSDPLLQGNYVVSIDAFNSNDEAIGTAPPINSTIQGVNFFTDLGSVEIPITGL